MAHVLSLATLRQFPGAKALADVALASIDADFGDQIDGGWFPLISSTDEPTRRKTAYEHAFILLAAASGSLAGRAGAPSLLRRSIAIVDEYFWDDAAGAMRESWDAQWSHTEDYRGANANMHSVEAFIAVADATGNDLWIDRAQRIAQRFVRIAREHGWLVPEHYDGEWRPILNYNESEPLHKFRPPGATPGHALEWARLLTQLWARDETNTWALDAARQLFERGMADGWDRSRGGVLYTTTFDGTPMVPARFHWVHCEAIIAADFLARATSQDGYLHWRDRLWEYTWAHFPDREWGSWHHELTAEAKPAATTWIGKPDVYHPVQACLTGELQLKFGVARSLAGDR
jgi:mannose/cellobiose epimerase-like protein (N-acyl-D-glucosamine 2-epimerase family)